LRCEDHGAGRPVLFVHGFPLSGRMWEHLVTPLSGAYRLIIPDLPGLGVSDVSAAISMAGYADVLSGLLEAVDERQPVALVGLSMGGYVAFEFYRRHRDRVRALVLADTRAKPDTEQARQDRERDARQVLRQGCAELGEAMLDKLFAPQASAQLRETWRRIMASSPPAGVAAALRAMAGRADSRPTLATIDVPTLIVVGEDDVLTPVIEAQTMHESIAGSRLVVVPGAGHLSPVEQPRPFAEALHKFLDSLE
jgi:pimeloyl-ACP methyl ester carboxylesterase